jgi:predicted dehydrogenase
VLCEKPLTRDPKEAERLFEVAERSGRVLIEGFMYQHHPQTKRLLEIVNQQAIGPLRVIRSCLRYTVASEADIRLSSSLAGGSLMDLGCYCVHSARSLAGEPERVYAERVVGPNGVEVALLGTLRFRHDVVAQFDSSFVTPMWQELEVVGEAGSARVAAPFRVDLGRPGIKLARRKVEMVQVEEGDSYALELEYFADVAEGKISTASAEDSIGQARTLAALYESVERGLPVDL